MCHIDLFVFAHKGLRHAMFDVASRLGRTDFADAVAAKAMLGELRTTLTFLREHAEHEEHTVFAEIDRHCPSLRSGLSKDHALIASQENRLLHVLDQFDLAAPAGRPPVGQHVVSHWHRVVSLHLAHMQREEEEASRVLHANCSEAELLALSARVLASIEEGRRAPWQALIQRGLSASECERMQQSLRAQELL